MKITKYPDNTSYITLDEPIWPKGDVYESEEEILARINVYYDTTFKLNSYEDLWHLNQYVEAVNSMGVTPHITIPCLLDAQADKRFHPLQSSGLKLVLKFLNDMDADFTIFHPHNPEVVEAMLDDVEIVDNEEFIREVFVQLLEESEYNFNSTELESKLILMSSDAGGFKPLIKLADSLEWGGDTYSASKARKWDEKKGTQFVQQVERTDFGGKDILIIDDICVYGGTFKGLSKLLKERNCGKLYLAVSHMTVDNLGEDHIGKYFDKIFTTNSKYDFYGYPNRDRTALNQIENLQIIKMF